jgi:hypothetical protein
MRRSYPYPIAAASNTLEYVLGDSGGVLMQFDNTRTVILSGTPATGNVPVWNGSAWVPGTANPVGMLHVHRNGTNQTTGLSGSTYNKIEFTTEVVDASGWFDNATNYRYTPLVAGRYMVILCASGAYASESDSLQASIYKNGSRTLNGSYIDALSTESLSTVSGILSMNGSTDYIEGFAYLPASPTAIRGATDNTYMMIYRVGD